MKAFLVLTTASALAATALTASASDITGKVTLKGTPPPEQVNNLIKGDAFCGKLHPETVTTRHYVVGANGELANVVVMLKNVAGKSTGASAPPVVLDQNKCEYVPQIAAVQTGQKLLVRNSDATLHNVHLTPTVKGNQDATAGKLNQSQLAKSPDVVYTFPAAENFLKFQCDVHLWMFAWITVVDHPYFAVTGADGTFKIANVPPGKYTLTALHRKAAPEGSDKEIEVKDAGTAQCDFTLEIK